MRARVQVIIPQIQFVKHIPAGAAAEGAGRILARDETDPDTTLAFAQITDSFCKVKPQTRSRCKLGSDLASRSEMRKKTQAV